MRILSGGRRSTCAICRRHWCEFPRTWRAALGVGESACETVREAAVLRNAHARALGFADYRGNRQYVSTGNLRGDGRVSLFLMDYPRKARLKLLGHATVTQAADDPDTAAKLTTDGQGRVERLFLIDIAAFDWNCPQFITPRYTEDELQTLLGPRMQRMAQDTEILADRLRALGEDPDRLLAAANKEDST